MGAWNCGHIAIPHHSRKELQNNWGCWQKTKDGDTKLTWGNKMTD